MKSTNIHQRKINPLTADEIYEGLRSAIKNKHENNKDYWQWETEIPGVLIIRIQIPQSGLSLKAHFDLVFFFD